MNTPFGYKVFFAFPFDAATSPMYEKLSKILSRHYRGRFDFWFGNRHLVEPSPLFARETFTAQNTDLFSQFYYHIRSADIIVADLSYGNPNVHLELGIALAMNKNILRVSGRNLTELGFDVRNHEVNNYRDRTSLYKILLNYLDLFLLIKDLKIDDRLSPFYESHLIEPMQLENRQQATPGVFKGDQIWPGVIGFRQLRDGEIRVRFKFNIVEQEDDWFGISVRFLNSAFDGSYMLYIRESGWLELVEMPTVRQLGKIKYPKIGINQEHVLSLNLDGSNIQASLDNSLDNIINVTQLTNQSFGNVALTCYRSQVEIIGLESLSRDTIDFSLPSKHFD